MSRSKTEYLHCTFSVGEGGISSEVAIEGAVIPRVERFKYPGSIIHESGEIDEDINQRINIEWQKWKKASRVLCDKRIPLKLKRRTYHRPSLLYGAECWPIKRSHLQTMKVTELRMIRRICGYTRLDKIRNEVIRCKNRSGIYRG